jgi:hypothetical protein
MVVFIGTGTRLVAIATLNLCPGALFDFVDSPSQKRPVVGPP